MTTFNKALMGAIEARQNAQAKLSDTAEVLYDLAESSLSYLHIDEMLAEVQKLEEQIKAVASTYAFESRTRQRGRTTL